MWVFVFQITVIVLDFANTWLESTNNLKYRNRLFSPFPLFICSLRYNLLDRHVICVAIPVYMSVCPQIPFLNQVMDFHITWYEECPTTANPTTILLIFYCGAGTTSAPLTFRLEVIFINSEIFGDRNLIKALMCLFKLTEKKQVYSSSRSLWSTDWRIKGVC